jgi:hypothetical protein
MSTLPPWSQGVLQKNLMADFKCVCSIVKCYSFGSDDGLLRDSARASVLRNNLVRLLQGLYISKHFGRLFALLQALLPWFTAINPLSPGVKDLLQFKSVSSAYNIMLP